MNEESVFGSGLELLRYNHLEERGRLLHHLLGFRLCLMLYILIFTVQHTLAIWEIYYLFSELWNYLIQGLIYLTTFHNQICFCLISTLYSITLLFKRYDCYYIIKNMTSKIPYILKWSVSNIEKSMFTNFVWGMIL